MAELAERVVRQRVWFKVEQWRTTKTQKDRKDMAKSAGRCSQNGSQTQLNRGLKTRDKVAQRQARIDSRLQRGRRLSSYKIVLVPYAQLSIYSGVDRGFAQESSCRQSNQIS